MAGCYCPCHACSFWGRRGCLKTLSVKHNDSKTYHQPPFWGVFGIPPTGKLESMGCGCSLGLSILILFAVCSLTKRITQDTRLKRCALLGTALGDPIEIGALRGVGSLIRWSLSRQMDMAQHLSKRETIIFDINH